MTTYYKLAKLDTLADPFVYFHSVNLLLNHNKFLSNKGLFFVAIVSSFDSISVVIHKIF